MFLSFVCPDTAADDVTSGFTGDVTDEMRRPTKPDTGEECFPCRQCGRSFKVLASYNHHRCSRVDDMLRCAKCQEMFLRPDYYKHVEYCNRQPNTKDSEKERNTFCCTICGFKGLSLFHREVHCAGVGGKAFGCSACSYKSDQKRRVYHHLKQNRGDKKHKEGCLQRLTELLVYRM